MKGDSVLDRSLKRQKQAINKGVAKQRKENRQAFREVFGVGKGKGRTKKGNFGSQSNEQYYDKNTTWGF